ncbi:MAG: glycosyltransferase family 39 protein [Tepidisphaeraceae bacterium]
MTTGRLRRTHLLWLLIAGAVCLLTFQGRRVLTEHEVFAAEPGREMLAGKGLLLQPFAGEYRTKKPPGQSWLIAASLGVTRSHSEWAARLPSALAGIGLALVVATMAARVGTSRQGLIAGLMTLTCLGVQQRARLAEADMALALCVATANAAVLSGSLPREYTGEGTRTLAILFWAAVAFGFLIKGPVVLGFTVLPALVSWAVLRFGVKNRPAATGVRRVAFWWPAVVGGVLLIALWIVLALREYPPAWDVWMHELSRVKGDVGHGEEQRKDPLLAYAWLLPQSTMPWCVFAIFGLATAWRSRRRPGNVLLASWGIGSFVLVSLSAFKVLHYILPAVAPVLMLAAVGFDRLLQRFLAGKSLEKRAGWEGASLAGWFGVATIAWLIWAAVIVPQKDWGRKSARSRNLRRRSSRRTRRFTCITPATAPAKTRRRGIWPTRCGRQRRCPSSGRRT